MRVCVFLPRALFPRDFLVSPAGSRAFPVFTLYAVSGPGLLSGGSPIARGLGCPLLKANVSNSFGKRPFGK